MGAQAEARAPTIFHNFPALRHRGQRNGEFIGFGSKVSDPVIGGGEEGMPHIIPIRWTSGAAHEGVS